jgi:oxygen-dependent protoporphyrinogen oxidase
MDAPYVVIGGGISGLAAALDLSERVGSGGVVLLESSPRLGGTLDSRSFAGRMVDTGPDGFLGRRPEALDLCRALGLEPALVPVGARGAGVWARGKVRPLPEGLALGIPTRFGPAARSGAIGLRGQLGLARDAILPRPDSRGPIGDRAIGPLVTRKLGRRVTEVLVDPLIGGIHAGSVDDMSAAAIYPPLLEASRARGSLMRALRAQVPTPGPDAPPLFWSLDGGMAALVGALAARLDARGVTIRCGAAVEAMARQGAGWILSTGERRIEAAGVVLAVSAPVAASLLRPHDAEVAGLLDGVAYASVALVTVRAGVDDIAEPLRGTGFLVPRHAAARGRDPWAVTACTYLSAKWPQLAREGDVLLRASVGRFADRRADEWDDGALTTRVCEELETLIGFSGSEREVMVARWPGAFPQYRVHHLLRTAGIAAALARLGGVSACGAAYQGVGIPACIASGQMAARALVPTA